MTGLALAAIVIGIGIAGTGPLVGLLVVIVAIAQGEYYLAVRKVRYRPATALGLVTGAMLVFEVYHLGTKAAPVILFLFLALAIVWHAWGGERGKALADLAVTLLGVLYIPLLASFAAAALRHGRGRGILLVAVGVAVVYDIGAYACGRIWGKTPLAPRISPGKTREGAIGATVVVVVLAAALAPLAGPWNVASGAVLGLMAAVVAPLGDLFESVLKRDLGIKDMGSILPGHGGALDRVDAILFCVPVALFSLRLFGH